MCRCVLLPCSGSSSPVELDVLSKILSNAGAAFSDALKVGNSVLKIKPERLYRIRNRVSSILGETVEDSRLLTQYAFYIACVKKVSIHVFIICRIEILISFGHLCLMTDHQGSSSSRPH